ncbi:hypothetical protein GCM10009841_35670 [Microlunatus panaciterrae]|uniref:Uncharacterized protein n=1 Tax=Microlunatus panaciterrae TaxID=400768 RepID=A0ABS2RGU1_9ACTN|nr:hypothetical protein [Microlunatus panaciterrae]MBM7798225.1 hypothetical protein [Microlunatus panaciterrae]
MAQMQGPWWATLTVWGVVNLVNLLQTAGFLSRRRHGMAVNHTLGWVIIGLSVPATMALIGHAMVGSTGWVGPAVFDLFVLLMLVVDYLRPVEFRHPARATILIPYLVLFFGGILLMGLPMFAVNRGLWLVTVATSVALMVSMVDAQRRGLG